VFRVSLLVVIFYYEVAKAALGGPVQLFWLWFWFYHV
jgi:hypothetical protein